MKNKNLKANKDTKGKFNKKKPVPEASFKETNDKDAVCNHNSYKTKGNHPSWYKTNDQLAKDTASIPFGYALGARKDHGVYGDEFNDYAVAGIMRINYTPIYGNLDTITSPLNIASRNIYTNLKSVNSRAKTYDAPDIAIYLCAIDNLLSYHEWIKRIYGLLNTASVTNRYYAEAAVRAAGGDYNDLLSNVNDFRAYINRFALRVSTLPIPAMMSIFARHAWLNAHVWYDSENRLKAQSYVFSPTGFWKYDLDEDSAGKLTFIRLKSDENKAELTFSEIKAIGEDLISAVLYGAGDEDFNIMGGDILYAYGEDKIYRATTITEDYAVVPEYDPWVCDQINNARAYGRLDTECLEITQDEDKRYLTQSLYVTLPNTFQDNVNFPYPWNCLTMDQYVNIFDADTSADHVMVATRLLNIPDTVELESEDTYKQRRLIFDCVGTEVVEDFCVYYYATTTGRSDNWNLHRSPLYKSINFGFDITFTDAGSPMITMAASQTLAGLIDCVGQLSSFDRKPLMYNAIIKGSGPDTNITNFTVEYTPHANIDLNNYSIISRAVLKQMNDNILLAMFGIDEFGKQLSLS